MNHTPPSPRAFAMKMWRNTSIFSGFVFIAYLMYAYALYGNFDFFALSDALLGTSDAMLSASLVLSAFSYFFDFLDSKLVYRKYLGLMGFWLALLYAATIMYLEPGIYFYGLPHTIQEPRVYLGIAAMGLLAFMAMISNNFAMRKLGFRNWRRLLRVGYIAYGLLAIRAYILEHDVWREWFINPETLPSVRLITTFFAACVILFRFAMQKYSAQDELLPAQLP